MAFEVLPAAINDRIPVPTLLQVSPTGSWVAADKGYISAPLREQMLADAQVTLVTAHRANMPPNPPPPNSRLSATIAAALKPQQSA